MGLWHRTRKVLSSVIKASGRNLHEYADCMCRNLFKIIFCSAIYQLEVRNKTKTGKRGLGKGCIRWKETLGEF
jgi:hypothetical protein